MSEPRTQVWSSGGGTQSAAIAALICTGELPTPDLAIIVDTEREKSTTWEYHETIIVPALAERVELVRVGKSDFATVDLYGKNGDLLIPAFTDITGNPGKLPTFCSDEWKRRVVMRWCRSQGVKQADNWVGISVDEMARMRISREQWFQNRYPLIELRKRRTDCYDIVRRMGWPDPPRSACYMCPNQGDREWAEMQRDHPEDFAAAVSFDHALRETDPNAYVHHSCKPLDEVEFTLQPGLFDDRACASGMCWV